MRFILFIFLCFYLLKPILENYKSWAKIFPNPEEMFWGKQKNSSTVNFYRNFIFFCNPFFASFFTKLILLLSYLKRVKNIRRFCQILLIFGRKILFLNFQVKVWYAGVVLNPLFRLIIFLFFFIGSFPDISVTKDSLFTYSQIWILIDLLFALIYYFCVKKIKFFKSFMQKQSYSSFLKITGYDPIHKNFISLVNMFFFFFFFRPDLINAILRFCAYKLLNLFITFIQLAVKWEWALEENIIPFLMVIAEKNDKIDIFNIFSAIMNSEEVPNFQNIFYDGLNNYPKLMLLLLFILYKLFIFPNFSFIITPFVISILIKKVFSLFL